MRYIPLPKTSAIFVWRVNVAYIGEAATHSNLRATGLCK